RSWTRSRVRTWPLRRTRPTRPSRSSWTTRPGRSAAGDGAAGRPATCGSVARPPGELMATVTPTRTSDPARTAGGANPVAESSVLSRWANAHLKWLFAAPAMTFVAVMIVFPLAWTVYLSLTD